MGRSKSRVAEEARAARRREAELKRKIQRLSVQMSNPRKYFVEKSDETPLSATERFRRYFTFQTGQKTALRRKPTKAQMRTYRNGALFVSIVAFIMLLMVGGRVLKLLMQFFLNTP